MKAIFGLGNPGHRYEGTRHNVGFEVVDELTNRLGVPDFDRWHSSAEYVIKRWLGGPALLLGRPLTFMNDSGQPIGELAQYYKIDAADLLIVLDEAQLPLGKLRARSSGSAGGHNGLKSVIAHLGTEVPRLRLGVGRGDDRRDLADHVLSRFAPDEQDQVDRMIERAAEAAELFVTEGIAAVMNQYNGGDPATTE